MGQKGCICGDDDDYRADIGPMSIERDLIAHRRSGDSKEVADAKIALDQHTHCVTTQIFRKIARRCACAALEFEADHAGAAPHVALSDWSRVRILHCGNRVASLYMEAVDVVQFTIPRFGDNR